MSYLYFKPTQRPTAWILAGLLMLTRIAVAQEDDDPRYDRIPQWYIEQAAQAPIMPSSVVTINDYDNFFLGVDFAEGHISAHPGSPAKYFTAFNTNGPWHTENGHDWVRHLPSFGGSIYGDPVTAYDSLGNLYYENMYGSGGSISGCKVVKSSNNGQNWNPAQIAISGNDKNWIAADQTAGPYANYVYTTMTNNGSGSFARSVDNGASWQNTASFSTQSLPGMMVAVGAFGDVQGGAVYVVTNGGSTTSSQYTFYRSTNGGQSFSLMSSQFFSGYVGTLVEGRHSVQGMRTRPYPMIAADNSYGPNRGRLYCVYASNDPPGNGNKPDIWCRRSDDGGATWSSAVRVNNDFNYQSNHQWHPAVWCDKNTGRLYVQWMDTRDTPTSDSALIYASYSDNGGVSFAPNKPVSNKKMRIDCPSCGGGGNPRYQGDYNGIVSNDNVAMLTFADWRNGNFGSYTAYFPDFAMKLDPLNLAFSHSDTLWFVVPGTKLYTESVIVQVSIETPPSGSFTYSFPEGFTLTQFPGSLPIVISADGVPEGEYTVTVMGKGLNGTPVHRRTATIEILPPEPPVADFTTDTTITCAEGGISFTDLSTNFPTAWSWQFPGGTPDTSNEQNPAGIAYNVPGVYSVTLTVTNVAGSNQVTKTDYITVNAIPDPPVAENITVCEEEPVPGFAAAGENIKWYDSPELDSLLTEGNEYQAKDTVPGIYNYYITQTINGCTSPFHMVTLTINALPLVTLADFSPVCSDAGLVELTGGTPEGGIYSGQAVGDGYFDPATAGPGTYWIYYTYSDENGCTSGDSATITVFPAASVSLGDDQEFCEGTSVTLDAGAGFASYLWNDGSTGQALTVDATGTFSVTVASESGCEDSDTVTLTRLNLPGAAGIVSGPASVDNFLQPVSQYAASEAPHAVTYTWTITPEAAGTLTADGLNAEVSWAPGYTGEVSLTITANNDCGSGPVSDPLTVTVYSSQSIGESNIGTFRVYPNPNHGIFTLEIVTAGKKTLRVTLVNALGDVVYENPELEVQGTFREVVRMMEPASGMLILRVSDGKDTWSGKVFIE
jgi:PKD repeat protein